MLLTPLTESSMVIQHDSSMNATLSKATVESVTQLSNLVNEIRSFGILELM